MDATDYWPFAREWNTAVAALQFWMADLNPQTLNNAIEQIYTAFFCSNSAWHLRNISEEILFGCFMTTLNDAFKWELALEDRGYESGSESLSIPTPLYRAPHLYHVSACANLSFRPATPRTQSPQQLGNLTTVCHDLMFEEDDSSLDNKTLHARMEHHSLEEHPIAHHLTSTDNEEEDEEEEYDEEHFPTAPLHDDVWMEESVLDRHLCIHEDSQNNLCSYLAHTAWISYTSLQIMHFSIWTSVTFSTSKMW